MMGLITCHAASQALSRRMEEPLDQKSLWSLRMHLLVCSHCRRFDHQAKVLRQAFARLVDRESHP
jgi:Putative zinc-finger